MIVDAHDLARGLHLRAKRDIDVRHLGKGEHGRFDGDIGTRRNEPRVEAEFLQRMPHRNLCRNVNHIDVRDLRKEWNGTARTRIHLDDEHLVMRHDELDVEQPLDVQGDGKALRIVDDRVDHARRQRLRRIDCDTVARVNAGALDVLHDARNHDIHTVGDGIDLDLGALHIAIHEHGMIRCHLDGTAHIVAQFFLIVDDLHRTAAEHIGGANHDGIADARRTRDSVIEIRHADALRA